MDFHQADLSVTTSAGIASTRLKPAYQAKDRLLNRQSVDPRENWIQLAFCIQKRPSQGRPQSTPGIENPVIALKTLATTGLEIAF
ncbi:hypothetical protein MITS9509_03535 [Synechococcus sp. MIT S9509]|nr:hypothetical protein MITS9509_03535 [Synechococcus sp. MIT S9509]